MSATLIPPVPFERVSIGQRLEALALANEQRCAMAAVRARVRALPGPAGRMLVAELLEEMPAEVGAMPIRRLLLSVRRLGERRMWEWLNVAQVRSGDRRVRDLSERQRTVLAGELRRVGGCAVSELSKVEQSYICDGCNVRAPFEHRCASDGCECELCTVGCEVCGVVVPDREARDWEWLTLPEGVFPVCPGCRK